jgi:hypothetical protein
MTNIIIIIAAITAAWLLCKKKDKPQTNNKIMTKVETFQFTKLQNLVVEELKSIECSPQIDKAQDVQFDYQGEHFFIQISSNVALTVYDTWWGTLKADDPDIYNLKEAINLTNQCLISTTIYSTADDGTFGVHTKYSLMLSVDINDNPMLPLDMLRAIFADIFHAHNMVKESLNKLNIEQQERGLNGGRKKISGFSVEKEDSPDSKKEE